MNKTKGCGDLAPEGDGREMRVRDQYELAPSVVEGGEGSPHRLGDVEAH